MKRAGVMEAAGVFAVLPSDQYNAFLALTAKGINPKVRVVSAQKELAVRQQRRATQFDHLTAVVDTVALQAIIAVGTALQGMWLAAGRGHALDSRL